MANQITQEDLVKNLGEILGETETRIPGGKNTLLAGAAFLGLSVLTITYFLGRRIGRLKSTTVEIRRV